MIALFSFSVYPLYNELFEDYKNRCDDNRRQIYEERD